MGWAQRQEADGRAGGFDLFILYLFLDVCLTFKKDLRHPTKTFNAIRMEKN